MEMTRMEMIAHICASGYITPLAKDDEGFYLFGKTKNNRAVCLSWEENEGGINRDAIALATYEIEAAGLSVPFVFFGRTSSYMSETLFKFLQIPWLWEERHEPILAVLQGMNMRNNLHPYRSRKAIRQEKSRVNGG